MELWSDFSFPWLSISPFPGCWGACTCQGWRSRRLREGGQRREGRSYRFYVHKRASSSLVLVTDTTYGVIFWVLYHGERPSPWPWCTTLVLHPASHSSSSCASLEVSLLWDHCCGKNAVPYQFSPTCGQRETLKQVWVVAAECANIRAPISSSLCSGDWEPAFLRDKSTVQARWIRNKPSYITTLLRF